MSRKTKPMEVKTRRVFGVPLLVNAQQTGQPLPSSIQRALLYLRDECLDQVWKSYQPSKENPLLQVLLIWPADFRGPVSPGGSVQEVWQQIPHPNPARAGRFGPGRCLLWPPVSLWRGWPDQAVLKGPAWTGIQQQAERHLPARLSVWVRAKGKLKKKKARHRRNFHFFPFSPIFPPRFA